MRLMDEKMIRTKIETNEKRDIRLALLYHFYISLKGDLSGLLVE